MGELPTQASLTAQIDCTGGGCFSFTRMGTGGGCCSFPPLLQLTVAVVRVVKTLASWDVGTWVHKKTTKTKTIVNRNLGYVGIFLEGLCVINARKFEAITGL